MFPKYLSPPSENGSYILTYTVSCKLMLAHVRWGSEREICPLVKPW